MNQIYLNVNYSITAANTCGLVNTTVQFIDQTGFSISVKNYYICNIDQQNIIKNTLVFTYYNILNTFSVVQNANGTVTVIFTSALNVQSTFLLYYTNSGASVTFPTQVIQVNSSQLVNLTVTQNNVQYFQLYILQGSTIVSYFQNTSSSAYYLNTKTLDTGTYQIASSYYNLCNEHIVTVYSTTISVGYKVKVICGASCTINLNTLYTWQGAQVLVSDLNVILPDTCTSSSYQCQTGVTCQSVVSLLSTNIICTAQSYTINYADLTSPYTRIYYSITSGAGKLLDISPEITQESTNLEVSSFAIKDLSSLTNYVCWQQFSVDKLAITFLNQPCSPTILNMTYVNYNVVDLLVQTCFNTQVTLKNQSFYISSLTISNTSAVQICDNCVSSFQIAPANVKNVVTSRLTQSSFFIQIFQSGSWQNTTIPVSNLKSQENITTFQVQTSLFTSGMNYRFLVFYDDVCYNYGNKQNVTVPIVVDQAYVFNIQSQIVSSAVQYYSTIQFLKASKDISACAGQVITFNLSTGEAIYTISQTITVTDNTNYVEMKIVFPAQYLVRTDKSTSTTRDYKFNSPNVICNDLFKNEAFYFVDKTSASIAAASSTICVSTISPSNLVYSNVDPCSANITNSITVSSGLKVTFTQKSCLDYSFTPIVFSTSISADSIAAVYANEVVTVTINATTTEITSVFLKNATVSIVCKSSSSTATQQILTCPTTTLSNGNYSVQITFSSGCVDSSKTIQISRTLLLNIVKTGWDNTDLNYNAVYGQVLYSFNSLPSNSKVEWTCPRLFNNSQQVQFKSTAQLVPADAITVNSDGVSYNCTATVTTGVDSKIYKYSVNDYSDFSANRCGIFYSEFDGSPTSIIRVNQNYVLKCNDSKLVYLDQDKLQINGFSAKSFTQTQATTQTVSYCLTSIGCLTDYMTYTVDQSTVPDTTSEYVNYSPQEKYSLAQYLSAQSQQDTNNIVINTYKSFDAFYDFPYSSVFLQTMNKSMQETVLRDFVTNGFSLANSVLYFNQKAFSDFQTLFEKASALNYTTAEKLTLQNRLLNVLTGSKVGLNYQFSVFNTITAQADFEQKKTTFTGSSCSIQLTQSEAELYSLGTGWATAEVSLKRVYAFIGLETALKAKVVFTNSNTSAKCQFSRISGAANTEEFDSLIGDATVCNTTAANGNITCVCNTAGRGVVFVGDVPETVTTTKNTDLYLTYMNIGALVITLAVGAISIIMIRQNNYLR
ncbi:Conserved_hypothetical protein [Hexamita inflata]|uniref:Uncharacterized protein n=1 Tax=Hexamita inflata TaxID=28002 RepID=A0AA86TUE3_9EUKA|nr:Conserved hypothetical protein [Hexamita inflata]